jgi:hypothetical protein
MGLCWTESVSGFLRPVSLGPVGPVDRSPPTLLKLNLLTHRRMMDLTGLQWAGAPVLSPSDLSALSGQHLPSRRCLPRCAAHARAGTRPAVMVWPISRNKQRWGKFPVLAHAHQGAWTRRAVGGGAGSPTPTRRMAPHRLAREGARHSASALGCT